MRFHVPTMAEINGFAGRSGLTAISTFSGCGGSSLGYKAAGFDVRVACEFIKEAAETYRANAPGTIVVERDIREIRGSDLLREAGLGVGELDLFDGSPPCSAFSFAGLRDDAWGEEKLYSGTVSQRVDDLFDEFIRLIGEIRPKTFIAENVMALSQGMAQGFFKEIYLKMWRLGYRVQVRGIAGDRIGIPQRRSRLIFIGVRDDIGIDPAYPKPIDVPLPLGAVISDLPHPFPQNLDDFESTPTSEREYDILRPGTRTRMAWDYTDTSYDHGCFRHAYQRLFNKDARYMWFKLPPNEVCPTITAKIHTLFRWDEPRSLSIPEIIRLATFPDDFELTGTFKQKWERIGRAVPPMMMGNIAMTLARHVFDFNDRTPVDDFIEGLTS